MISGDPAPQARAPAVFTDPHELFDPRARRRREYTQRQNYLRIPRQQREAMGRSAAQIRADFAPQPEPMQQHDDNDNAPLLRGLVGRRGPQDWRMAMYQQGSQAFSKAVDDTNDAWSKEMDRRAEHANDERDRQHELDLEAMQQQGNAEREAAAMQHEQSKQAFLANLLASSGMVPRTLRFGG